MGSQAGAVGRNRVTDLSHIAVGCPDQPLLETQMAKQLECRVVITHHSPTQFELGMFDPVTCRYEALGKHPTSKIDKIVRDLKERMERERHIVTFSEVWGQR